MTYQQTTAKNEHLTSHQFTFSVTLSTNETCRKW